MMASLPPSIRKWSRILHRDFGYLLSAFVVSYCLSGIALNHVDEWNPDFVVQKREITLDREYAEGEVDDALARQLGRRVGEDEHRILDVPTAGQIKIYYDNASLHLYLAERRAVYERIARRPVFYEANVLHRNSFKPWRWFSDAFSILLVLVNLTGLLILKGRHGLAARGKWLIAAGLLPPVAALIAFGTS